MIRTLPLLLLATAQLNAADSLEPGEVSTPFPTINHLAVEWQITGDDDLDASCELRYRKVGAETWTTGMTLRRVPAGSSKGTNPIVSWTNRLSGSLFDLEAGTTYEIALKLHDPDGGSATRIVQASTRPEPIAPPDAPTRKASKDELHQAKPGEVLLLEDGDYGAMRFNRDGEPGKPIVYRSTTGAAIFSEIGLTDRQWVYLEGVTVNGPVRLNNTQHCVVRRCKISAQWGIKAYEPGMLNGCIEDNVVTGIQPWKADLMGATGDNDGEGIQITGSGNVIRFNRVSGFRDCLSHMEDSSAVPQHCNDWLNNDVSLGLDDGIEADFAGSNCRILRNRITNCFVGISSQPGLGGPNYFMHNVMFNLTYTGFKLHRYSQGDVILRNTVVKIGDGLGIYTSEPFDHTSIQHNLFIGGKSPIASFNSYSPGRGRAVDVQQFGQHCVIDHNAYAVQGLPFEGKIRTTTFTSLPGKEFETHGQQVSVDILQQPAFPDDPLHVYPPPDLRLKPGSPDMGAYSGGESKILHYGPRHAPSH